MGGQRKGKSHLEDQRDYTGMRKKEENIGDPPPPSKDFLTFGKIVLNIFQPAILIQGVNGKKHKH